GPARGEDQRPAVARQTGLLLGSWRVQRGPEVHGGGPRVVHAAAGGPPQIGPAQATRARREEEDLSAVGAQCRTLVGTGRIAELGNKDSGTASLPVPCERRIVKIRRPARRCPVEIEVAYPVLRALQVLRARLARRRVDVGPD